MTIPGDTTARRLGIALAIVASLFLIAVAGSVALIESQEVVVIRTTDTEGEAHSARVWVVDYEGGAWVAPGNRTNGWFQRLLLNPRVELTRSGTRRCYTGTVVEGPAALPVLERFLEKYRSVIRVTGFLNRLLEPRGDPSEPVAVRLSPCSVSSGEHAV